MCSILKRLAGRLPRSWQQGMKRVYFAGQIRRGTFRSDEMEYERLGDFVSPGDCVLDVGANVGHYTLRLSELVGAEGRVFAFEPIPETFELLTANCTRCPFPNVTLLNVAASDRSGVAKMQVPAWDHGGARNYYEARMSPDGDGPNVYSVFTLAIDSLDISRVVSVVKVDVEGHERAVLKGMVRLLERCHPTVITEGNSAGSFLEHLAYQRERAQGAVNSVYHFGK